MESSQEESREKHPSASLPPNYVSLVQLQEQWLQKQTKKQIVEQRKENQKQKQPEKDGKLVIASQSRRQENGKKKFCDKEQSREGNERRRVQGHQKGYTSKRVLDGNRSEIGGAERQSKSEEFKVGAPADHRVHGVGGMEVKGSGGKRKKNGWNKRVARVNGSLIGVQDNRENLGDSSWRNGGEENGFGGNGNGDREVEGKVSVCMLGVVPENKGKEVTLSGDVSAVESLLQNGSEEEVPMAGNGVDRGTLDAGSVCMTEVLPKINVEVDCSVNVGRKRGEGRYRGKYQRNVDNRRKWRDSMDSKMELGYEKNVVEEGVSMKEIERNGMQKERTARVMQAYSDKEMVSGNMSTRIRRDFRFLSLDESTGDNVTLRKEQHGSQRRRFEKSRNVNGLVWVKKGEISDTNVAEI